jgi:hypothetical protein
MTNAEDNPSGQLQKKPNRFQKNPWLAIIILTLVLLAGIEILSQMALWVRNTILMETQISVADQYMENLLISDDIDSEQFSAEMKDLYINGIEFHPYRWYRLPANYSGKYFKTDGYGFRNDPEIPLKNRNVMAFYGGSTMFSIRTSQEKTIPGIINNMSGVQDSIVALNMGIGAYSSSNELNTFLETSRNYPIHTAVFFDGVNEVTRYLEKFMYRPDDSLYHSIGYPYFSTLEIAFGNTLKKQATEYEVKKKSTWKPATYWVAISIIGKIKNLFNVNPPSAQFETAWVEADYAQAGKIAAQLYLNNIRDISAIAKSRGIRAVFILQPTLFSSSRIGDNVETSYTSGQHPFVEAIHRYTYTEIQNAPKGDLEFYDLSHAFDDLPQGQYFYDWHHCNAKGNEHLAAKILEKIMIRNF